MVQKLADALSNCNLKPEPFLVKLVSAKVLCRGEKELAELSIELPGSAFRQLCVRNLGSGSCLTDFLISHMAPNRSLAARIATLGGLFLTIAAGFDHLLDNSVSGPPRLTLSEDSEGIGSTGNPLNDLIQQLTVLYLRLLRSMPVSRPEILAFIESAITRLYTAELMSARKDCSANLSVWWRKNALLTAVMGMPAWLGQSGTPTGSFRDLLWLCRVGEFLGWIDDVADHEMDLQQGHLNRIATLLSGAAETYGEAMKFSHTEDSLISKVTRKGRRVISEWDRRNRVSPARDVFAVIVWTWGGNR